MRITLVRHGESEANVVERWQGQGDSPLSWRGREQAAMLADRLASESFDLIVASDLSRAADTARALGRKVDFRSEWREIDVGSWEGLTRQEVAEKFPEEIIALRSGELIPIGGGESWVDVEERVVAAYQELAARLPTNGHALVVAHGGVLVSLVRSLLGLARRNLKSLGRLDNTSVTTLAIDSQGTVTLERFNDVSHSGTATAFTKHFASGGGRVVTLVDPATPESVPRVREIEHWLDAQHVISGANLGSFLSELVADRSEQWIGVTAASQAVAELASTIVRLEPGSARIAGLAAHRTCHVLVEESGFTLADFNVG